MKYKVHEGLSQRDVQSVADEFRPLYDRTDGEEGVVRARRAEDGATT
jgi:hypothetical protein